MISRFYSRSIFLLTFLAFIFPVLASAGIRSEIHITPDGKFIAKDLKVFMVPEPGKSTFFYARSYWDDVFIRLIVLTDKSTSITKQYGEKATVFDIKEGDMINVEGILPSSSDTLNVQATKIVDRALTREQKEVRGIVISLATSSPDFVIKTAKGNLISITTSNNTSIIKGARTIPPSDIKVGDTALSITGIFDYSSYNLEAGKISVYQDNKIFQPKNFEGTILSISGTTLPVSLSVKVDGKNYAVYLSDKASVFNKARVKASLSRFFVGDTVRFYGSVRPTDLSAIDADTIRDINF